MPPHVAHGVSVGGDVVTHHLVYNDSTHSYTLNSLIARDCRTADALRLAGWMTRLPTF